MAAINFPDNPSLNQEYSDKGFTYKWNGTVWISVGISTTRISNIREIDDISSSFNGSTTSFAIQVGGTGVTPVNVQQLIISIGGVIQNPGDDYSLSGGNIVFSTAPANGLDFFGTILGTDLSLNTVADNTVSPAKFTTGGPTWTTYGSVGISSGLTVAGVATVSGNAVIGGVATIAGTTQSTNKDTGALVLEGGLGVEKNINAGGNIAAVGNITGVNGTFSGDVSIGGTLTKQDVTNVDSVGVVTARTGIRVLAGGIDVDAGGINVDAGDVDIAGGKLGIGTVNPEARVEIYDTNAQGLIVRAGNTQGTDTNKALRVRNNSATDTFSVSHKGLVYSATKLNVGAGAGATVDTTGFYIGGNSTFIKTTGASLPALTVAGVTTSTGGFMIGITSATSTVITNGPIKTLNFIGAGNTFQVTGTTVDISIAGGGGGGGSGLSQFQASGVGPGATIRTI